jgi:HK97 gp10 family phage protein
MFSNSAPALTIEIQGLRQLDQALRNMAWPAARRALRRGMRAGANEVRDEARARAPVRTRKLKRSIRTRERSEADGQLRFAVEVPRKAFYGLFLEYGTVKMPARPFLRPAAEAKFEQAVGTVRRALAQAIDEELRRARR